MKYCRVARDFFNIFRREYTSAQISLCNKWQFINILKTTVPSYYLSRSEQGMIKTAGGTGKGWKVRNSKKYKANLRIFSVTHSTYFQFVMESEQPRAEHGGRAFGPSVFSPSCTITSPAPLKSSTSFSLHYLLLLS